MRAIIIITTGICVLGCGSVSEAQHEHDTSTDQPFDVPDTPSDTTPDSTDTTGDTAGDGTDTPADTMADTPDDETDGEVETCLAAGPTMADVRITDNSSASQMPSIAWTGSEFGLTWDDDWAGHWDIYFARISASGSMIGTATRVTDHPGISTFPSIAWSGSEFGLGWYDDRDGNYEIYFCLVSSLGSKTTADIRITDNDASSMTASLAWSGSEYGLAWEDARDGHEATYFRRISASGTPLGSDARISDVVVYSAIFDSPEWTGSEYGLVWRDGRDGNGEIYFARVSALGVLVGSNIRVTNSPENKEAPSIAWTGSDFWIGWYSYGTGLFDIYMSHVAADGTKIGTDIRMTDDSTVSTMPVIAWTGSEVGLAWNDERDGNGEIYFARVSADGYKLGSDVRITDALEESGYPALLWTGTEFGVAWHDRRDGDWEIFFNIIDPCL